MHPDLRSDYPFVGISPPFSLVHRLSMSSPMGVSVTDAKTIVISTTTKMQKIYTGIVITHRIVLVPGMGMPPKIIFLILGGTVGVRVRIRARATVNLPVKMVMFLGAKTVALSQIHLYVYPNFVVQNTEG